MRHHRVAAQIYAEQVTDRLRVVAVEVLVVLERGVVDEHVDLAESPDRGVKKLFRAVRLREVRAHQNAAASGRLHAREDFLRALLA